MDNHPIEGLMKSTLENLKDMIDVNTIIGDTIETGDGTTIIPISCISLGFASGGSEFNNKSITNSEIKYPFGGGSGSGISVKPVALLVIKGDIIRLLSFDSKNTCNKLIDSIPQIIDSIKSSISEKPCKKDKKKNNKKVNSENAEKEVCMEEKISIEEL